MAIELTEQNGIRLAIEGCGHGTLHAIYASISESCKQKSWPGIDLLIIGGDFQSVRNAYDLNCVSMPPKYREMCDFHEYYSGDRTAPYLTIFVGGNHEASNYLFELYYGGWVAPNIYYMGAANVIRLGPLRIAGLSGIWKGFDYRKPHFERLPYNESDIKSVYHVRELDVRKLLQIRTQVDVAISHDWPQGIEWKGNFKKLFNMKKHFQDDARSGRLGSVAAKQVLDRLRPVHWFSAHLHCKYAAKVSHAQKDGTQKTLPNNGQAKMNEDEIDLDADMNDTGPAKPVKNEDEIDLDLDNDEANAPSKQSESGLGLNTTPAASVVAAPQNADEIDLEMDDDPDVSSTTKAVNVNNDPDDDVALANARAALPAAFAAPKGPEAMEHPPDITNLETNFLALDKCLSNRDFLQLLSIATDQNDLDSVRPLKLEYDREWLAVTRAFALSEPPTFGNPDARVPYAKSQTDYQQLVSDQRPWIDEHLTQQGDLIIPENFQVTAPVYDGGHFQDSKYQQVDEYPNPQTAQYCKMLQIQNPLAISEDELASKKAAGPRPEPEFHGGARGRGGFDRGRGRGGFGGRGGGRGGQGGGRRGFRGSRGRPRY